MIRSTSRPILAYFDAIKNLRLRQIAMILKAGYDPNLMVNSRGQNGLQYLISYFGATDAHFRLQLPINRSAYLGIAKLLLDSGLDPNAMDLLTNETVMFDTIRFNEKEMISLLLNYVDLSLRNKNGETALMCAARFGSKQVMRMILEHLRQLDLDGYLLRQRNRFGLTALEIARAENIECAKVLTKHLITYGHHASTVLARSTSHHQLRSLPYHMRPRFAGTRGPPPGLFVADSATDDDDDDDHCDLLASGPSALAYEAQLGARATGAGRAALAARAYYPDSKAAQFNQYLLEQHASDWSTTQAEQQATMSDDEDYLLAAGRVGSGGLTRSRSCMLGPNSGKQQAVGNQQKFATGSRRKSQAVASGSNDNTKGSAHWESSNIA